MKFVWLFFLALQSAAVLADFEEMKEEFSTLVRGVDVKEAMDKLVESYEFSEDSIVSSYEHCKDQELEGPETLGCFMDTIFKKRILEKHQLLLCAGEYFGSTAIECVIACFDRYNPECLKCLGDFLPRFFDCLQEAPYEYML